MDRASWMSPLRKPVTPRGIAILMALAVVATLPVVAHAAAAPSARSVPSTSPPRPRLVVLISIDQFRADYLERFRDLFLPVPPGGKPGGFRWLMERGAYHTDARHDHFHLFTGPGHAVLLTGAPPYKSGIVGNAWWDRKKKAVRGCVEDPDSPLIGNASTKTGVSPRSLLVSTVGDELKMATGGRAKVWGLGFKDRAGILMAGHLADGVLWFDEESGRWISSRWYFKSGRLPRWTEDWNARKPIDAWFGKTWTLSVPPAALARVLADGGAHASPPAGQGATFPHRIDGGATTPGKVFYRSFATSAFANGYVLDTAREIVTKERLGQDDVPDILAINLSSNDYVGHDYGPDSAEVLDISVQTDRQLAGFFQALASSVPGGLERLTIVLSADHGVAPNAMAMKDAGFDAGVYDEDAIGEAANAACVEALGDAKWVAAVVEGEIYLDLDVLAARKIARERVEDVAADAIAGLPGVSDAVTRTHIRRGELQATDVSRRIASSFHPARSGDVVLVPASHWTESWAEKGATHGSPYAYDTRVPILFAGAGVRPGVRTDAVSTLDVAPTLARLLRVLPPSGCEGRVLDEDLK